MWLCDAGIFELPRLKSLTVGISNIGPNALTSFCSLPESLSRLSTLTGLYLGQYFNHVETRALLNLTSLRDLYLHENRIEDPANAAWVQFLPTSLTRLAFAGKRVYRGDDAKDRQVRRLWGVPCVTRLHQLDGLSFHNVRGFRADEWKDRSCLVGLSALRVLELTACRLRAVPNALLGLSSLVWLRLSINKLTACLLGSTCSV